MHRFCFVWILFGTSVAALAQPGLKPAPKGDSAIALVSTEFKGGIRFGVGSAALPQRSTLNLERLAVLLKRHPDERLRLEGFADSTGSPESNLALSRRRAEAVRDHLVGKGVDADQIRVLAHGEARPVADNRTPAGRALNRRVELVIEITGETRPA